MKQGLDFSKVHSYLFFVSVYANALLGENNHITPQKPMIKSGW